MQVRSWSAFLISSEFFLATTTGRKLLYLEADTTNSEASLATPRIGHLMLDGHVIPTRSPPPSCHLIACAITTLSPARLPPNLFQASLQLGAKAADLTMEDASQAFLLIRRKPPCTAPHSPPQPSIALLSPSQRSIALRSLPAPPM